MNRTFLIADTHFGHNNILSFKREDGSPLRDFASIEEHDETMIDNWNRVVRPQDKVYHLGDVVINRRCLPVLSRLNGHKRLVRGNHDLFATADFLAYFEEIYGVRVLPRHRAVLSHIPVHPESLSRWKVNIHGHLHARVVLHPPSSDGKSVPDTRYRCVSAEQVDYTPVDIEELLSVGVAY